MHDVYVFNHGEKSAAEENAYTGIEDISSAVEANTTSGKVSENGRIVIIKVLLNTLLWCTDEVSYIIV